MQSKARVPKQGETDGKLAALGIDQSVFDRRLSRRAALSTGAKAAIGVGIVVVVAGAGYAAYSAMSTGPTSTSSTTSSSSSSSIAPSTSSSSSTSTSSSSTVAPSSTSSSSSASASATGTGPNLTFVHWHFNDTQVTQYVQDFETETGANVTQETLDNANYNPLIETKFQGGEIIDMNYANAFEAFRLIRLGYTRDVESMTDMATIKSEMYPAVVQAYSTSANKLAGLPYFWSARSCPVTNDAILSKVGLNGQFPTTWDDFWSMATTVQKAGVTQYPVMPNWFNADYGIMWDFQAELGNINNDPQLTSTLFDTTFAPVFDTNTAVADMLQQWQTVTKQGLVDPAVFSMSGDNSWVLAMDTGAYALQAPAIYYFQTMNEPSQSKIPVGDANIAPVAKQAWGVIDSGLYCWPVKTHSDTASQDLIKFFGYKDPKTGQRLTQNAWAIGNALFSGYTDTISNPSVIAGYQAWLGNRTTATLKIFNDIAAGFTRPWIWKSPLYTPFADQAFPILGAIASGGTPVAAGVTQLRQAADTLYKQYGSS